MNSAVLASDVNMAMENRNLFARKGEGMDAICHTSPRISSPLTPPATGETKINNNGESSSSTGGGEQVRKHKPKHLSASPTTSRILNTFPIRDSPGNPFLQGGPADAGLSGPRMWQARQRMAKIPKRERGKMTYVFRGQRVTYAEPFASDSDEEDEAITSTYLGNGNWRHERNNDRLQPRILFPQAMSTSSSASSSASSSLSRKRPAQLDYLSASSSRITSRKSDSYLMQDHQKRRKVDGLQEKNRDLIDHLDRTGWNSDGEMDLQEEDEVSQTMLSKEEVSKDCSFTDKTIRPRHQFDSDDESEVEEIEVEENPFLDAAPMQRSTSRTYEHERSIIFGIPAPDSEQTHNIYTSNHPFSTFSSNPYASRPRGHAHSLAHSMHVPGHLRGRRY